MKLIHHKLENGSGDPIETNFKGFDDLWEWAKFWQGIGDSPRVYLACFSTGSDFRDMFREIIVTDNKMAVRLLVAEAQRDVDEKRVTYLHLQEYSNFQSAYEVAFYMREGHPLAYPPITNQTNN